MTYAPADLLAVQRYARDKTGQAWASLGIIHSTPQGGGYHEGHDLLVAANRAPGPQFPYSDYSYTDAPTRDLAPPHDMTRREARLAGADAASGFDLGGAFPRFLEFNAWMRQKMLAGDPRTRDIREMIHTLDRRAVRRIDRTGKQPDGGDDSHLSHTHFSFFRDSIGRRDRDDNFLGLLREFFEGARPSAPKPEVPAVADVALTDVQARQVSNSDQYQYEILRDQDPVRWIAGAQDGKRLELPNLPLRRAKRIEQAVTETLPALLAELRGPAAVPVALSEADRQAIIDGVVGQLKGLIPTAKQVAIEVADEGAHRLSNG